MRTRTKPIALATGVAALTALATVPASGQGSNFVLISNRDSSGQVISITEYPNNNSGAPADKSGTWTVGSKKAHYWNVDFGDWVEVTGPAGFNPQGFDERIAASDLPACFRINGNSIMYRVYGSCDTSGASETWW